MIVAGFGYRSGAGVASLRAALATTGGTPDRLAAPADKCALLEPLAQALNLPLTAIASEALQAVETETQSPASHTARGTGSVAEAAALAAAGPGARLICARVISPDRMATCALAEGNQS